MRQASADSDAPVVIVGGGPVGMGLAIGLGQRGIKTIVVERHEQPQPIPKGQNLTQRTMEHFHFWGAEAALRAARTIPPDYGIGGMTSYGTLLSGYNYNWLQRELVRPFYFTDNERLPQYATEAVLRQRAVQLPSVDLRYGWTCRDVRPDAEGVSLDIESRDGMTQSLRADYVIGCDGSRSIVRERAGITQTRSDHDRLMVLLVFRSVELHRLLEAFPGKSFYSVLHPDLEGYWKFFGRVDLGSTWFFHAPVPADTTADNFDFRRLLHDAAGAQFDIEFEHIGFGIFASRSRTATAQAASSSPEMLRTAIRPMAAMASTPALRTPQIWRGSSPRLYRAGRQPVCSTATMPSGVRCLRPPRAISSRRRSSATAIFFAGTIRRAIGRISRPPGTSGTPARAPRSTPSSRITRGHQSSLVRPALSAARSARTPIRRAQVIISRRKLYRQAKTCSRNWATASP